MACTICGMGQLARTDPDAAVAVTLFLGTAEPNLNGFKEMMCPDHRREWALLLIRGGYALGPTPEVGQ